MINNCEFENIFEDRFNGISIKIILVNFSDHLFKNKARAPKNVMMMINRLYHFSPIFPTSFMPKNMPMITAGMRTILLTMEDALTVFQTKT